MKEIYLCDNLKDREAIKAKKMKEIKEAIKLVKKGIYKH